MKRLLSSLVLLIILGSDAHALTDSLLRELTRAIEKAPAYDAEKDKRIAQLRSLLYADPSRGLTGQFLLYEKLYDEYRIFHYDSAYRYAGKMQEIAYRTGDRQIITAARLKLCFILLSSGLFRETYDSLRSIAIAPAPDSLKAEYYTLMGRYYYDLANYDFDGAYHSLGYDDKGTLYMDSALAYYPPGSFEHVYYSGLRDFKRDNIAAAALFFEQLLASGKLTDHQLALTASTLSGIYFQKGQREQATDLMISAAIADIHSSTKETYAIFNLADLLYKNGDVRHASLCIETAIANAEFYGARQRKVQLSSVLSLIEGERINAVESQRKLLIQYAVVVTLFMIILAVLIFVIRHQVKKLQKAQRMIT